MKFTSTLLSVAIVAFAASSRNHVEAFSLRMSSSPSVRFTPPPKSVLSLRLASSAAMPETTVTIDRSSRKKTKETLGLITFDLDDSLYPIEPVLSDANRAFSAAMERYGYSIDPEDIVKAGKKIRENAGPAGVSMSHTEVRLQAIKEEMERVMYEKKLRECAADWATEVESLTAPLKNSAKKWAKSAVSPSVVESIYSAWERERHHSAERHLYPEIISALQKIKEDHPNVIIGAVTDGKANPMLMVFSLAPYFDFCMSWEDDAAGRMEFFKELGNVDGNAGLQWIYQAAYDKYLELAESTKVLKNSVDSEDEDYDEPVWIHIGDDLAYDVGGSASCGAKTILLDLDDEYRQSAKLRFGENPVMPSWSTASAEELANRKAMNEAAEEMVDKRVSRLSMLPDAIDEILKDQ